MRMDNMVCPNCGAPYSHYGTCEYCGSVIQKQQVTASPKQNDAESIAQKIAKYRDIKSFSGGVAVVSSGGGLHGVINEQGDLVLPLSSSEIENYDGRLLVYGNGKNEKVVDAHGNILVEAYRIYYIGNGEFLLRGAEGSEAIFNQKNEIIAVQLPEGISISNEYGYEPSLKNRWCKSSLGYGCYVVCDSTNNNGIALKDRLLLPCHYDINDGIDGLDRFGWEKFFTDNEHLVVVEDRDIAGRYCRGLFDLEKKQIILPCHYYFDKEDYKDKLLRVRIEVRNGKWHYGVFDADSQKLVIQPEYNEVDILDNRVCRVTKYRLFGSKTKTIQL